MFTMLKDIVFKLTSLFLYFVILFAFFYDYYKCFL